MEKAKRYIVFFIGLFINALGISFITKADLGTSPISSIPYTLSLYFPFTLGEFTVAFSVLLILLQILLLRSRFEKIQLLQIPVSLIFGYFIDFTMNLLFFLAPQSYPTKLVSLFIGCLILGFGVYTEVLANVVMLPGEGFVKAVCTAFNREFGKTKVCFDASMSIGAAVISLVLFHHLEGVREGTIISALLIGTIAGFYGRKLSFLPGLLFGEKKSEEEKEQTEPENGLVITIAREYGSGGHDIGKALAKELGIPFYDRSIIDMTATEGGFSRDFVEKNEQAVHNPVLQKVLAQFYAFSGEDVPPADRLFLAEWKVISEIAAKGSCVIVGRCADVILRHRPHAIRLFIHAPEGFRRQRAETTYGLTEGEAAEKVRTINEERARHYKKYTGGSWGSAENYHLSVDSSLCGVEDCAKLLVDFVQKVEKNTL